MNKLKSVGCILLIALIIIVILTLISFYFSPKQSAHRLGL